MSLSSFLSSLFNLSISMSLSFILLYITPSPPPHTHTQSHYSFYISIYQSLCLFLFLYFSPFLSHTHSLSMCLTFCRSRNTIGNHYKHHINQEAEREPSGDSKLKRSHLQRLASPAMPPHFGFTCCGKGVEEGESRRKWIIYF